MLKYSVKPGDMMRDYTWFFSLVDQVHAMRSGAGGGVLTPSLRARKREDVGREPGEEEASDCAERLSCGWQQDARRYRRIGNNL